MRKKLFAILMSAMMMVTFMPAMAFAGSAAPEAKVTVSKDYKTATLTYVSGDSTYTLNNVETTRTFKEGNGNGYVEVTVATGDAVAAAAEYSATIMPQEAVDAMLAKLVDGGSLKVLKKYYDLTDSTLAWSDDGNTYKVIPSNLTNAEFQQVIAPDSYAGYHFEAVAIYEPAELFAERKADDAKATRRVAYVQSVYQNTMNGYTFALKPLADGAFDPNSKAAQTVELQVVYTGSDDDYPIYQGVTKKTFNIAAGTYTAADAEFYIDEVTTANKIANANLNTVYDGAEHKIVMKEMTGFEASYEKFNTSNGQWEAVDGIVWKNVADSAKYRVTVKNTAKATDTLEFDLVLDVAKAQIKATLKGGSVFEGTAINAYDFVTVTGEKSNTGNYAWKNKVEAASKKAVAAEEAAIKAALATKYNVEAKKTTTPATVVGNGGYTVVDTYTLKMVNKWNSLTTAEKTAYKAALANYNLKDFDVDANLTITVYEGKANELDFLGNASMKKTVHVKNAKAVKKAAVRHIKAEALSGTAVTFKKMSGSSKIAVAADGTMTIKKGLKKGTYKVVVKATAAAGNGYKRLTAKATYTVKVVK